jgi:DNA-binding SARP family transcriptional activator
MDALRVCLFGRLDVRYRQQALSGFEAHTVQDLFCYLLLYRQRPHSREALADLLWGEQAATQSRRYLRKVLWQLQSALDAQVGAFGHPLLLVEPDWVQVDPKANLWLDVAVFEQAFMRVQGIPGKLLDSRCARELQDAVDLYQGDLLEGCYHDWCIYERERFQHMYLAMLDKLMDHCQARQDYEAGLSYGRRILRYDRARERTHRRLMRLYYLAGDRTAALRHYERCVAALEKDLGVKPTRSTRALYEQIRADRLDELPVASFKIGLPPVTGDQSLVAALDRLKQLHVALVDVQRRLQQEIKSVELALESQR